jgi:hypothetical protein
MKKFVNHVDHVTWISRLANIEQHVADLEAITDGNLLRFEREDMVFVMYIDWDAGLEVVAPMDAKTDFNQGMHDWLDTRGEGLMGIVFGVENLEKHKEKLEAKGMFVGPLMDDLPTSPWHHRLVMRERIAPAAINSMIVLGQIDYADDVIRFEDVKEDAEAGTGAA